MFTAVYFHFIPWHFYNVIAINNIDKDNIRLLNPYGFQLQRPKAISVAVYTLEQ